MFSTLLKFGASLPVEDGQPRAPHPQRHLDRTMALKACSPLVAMTATPLSQAQTARLHAAECHRLKSEHGLLCNELRILGELQAAERRLGRAQHRDREQRYTELCVKAAQIIRKTDVVDDQLLRLGGRGGALSQASVSGLGTMTFIERVDFTRALEPQEFKDGALLIKEGEPRDAFYIVVQGQVSCTQRRGHRCGVGPARAALLERLPRPRLSAPARQRLSTPAPQHAGAPRCSARQGLGIAARDPERHQGPLAPRGFERSNPRATQTPISRTYTTGPASTSLWSSETAC